MRLVIIAIFFLSIVCIVPTYGSPTSNTTNHTSTGYITIQNSTLFGKLLNIERNMNNCQKNVTENCQIVSSKLDNLTNTTMEMKNEVDQDNIYGKAAIIAAILSLIVAGMIFYVQDRQGKKLRKLVDDVHDFSEDQKSIKEAKRKRYSRMILFGLQLIDFEIEGIRIQQKFRDKKDARMSDKERKQIQINHYEKAQKIFVDMKIEYDAILEIFNQEIESQYRQAWTTLLTQSLYVNFDNSAKIWETINKIEREFANLKNFLIEYVDTNEKSTYSNLFDPKRYEKMNSDDTENTKNS